MAREVPKSNRVGVSEAIRLRMEPQQTRSNTRIIQLLDGAASYIHSHGFETMTTQAVVEMSGNSIGTLYRFFNDRVDVLNALVVRNYERLVERVSGEIASLKPNTPGDLMDAVFAALVWMFKNEPGFKSIRVGDCLDIRPAPAHRHGNAALSRAAADKAQVTTGLTVTGEQLVALETGVDVADTLLAKAFLVSARGDKATIERARSLSVAIASGRAR